MRMEQLVSSLSKSNMVVPSPIYQKQVIPSDFSPLLKNRKIYREKIPSGKPPAKYLFSADYHMTARTKLRIDGIGLLFSVFTELFDSKLEPSTSITELFALDVMLI